MDTTAPPNTPSATVEDGVDAAARSAVRELDHRRSDGIDVRLLWNEHTGSISIALEDSRLEESITFEVAAAEALAAFHHPYAYAAGGQGAPSP